MLGNYEYLCDIVNKSYCDNKNELGRYGFRKLVDEGTDTEFIYKIVDSKIIVCFRGVDKFRDIFFCFNFLKRRVGGVKVHRGVYRKFLSFLYLINSEVDIRSFKSFDIYGYSLGGGLAQIFSWWLLENGVCSEDDIKLYILGSMRVGDKGFISVINRIRDSFCIRFNNDFITYLPFRFLGFYRMGNFIVYRDVSNNNFIMNHWDYDKVDVINFNNFLKRYSGGCGVYNKGVLC